MLTTVLTLAVGRSKKEIGIKNELPYWLKETVLVLPLKSIGCQVMLGIQMQPNGPLGSGWLSIRTLH